MKQLFIFALLFVSVSATAQNTWKPNPKYIHYDSTTKTVHYQCMGTTKKGTRCKRDVPSDKMYCKQHQYQK